MEEYERRADEVLRIVEQTPVGMEQDELRRIARQWLLLARRARDKGFNDLL